MPSQSEYHKDMARLVRSVKERFEKIEEEVKELSITKPALVPHIEYEYKSFSEWLKEVGREVTVENRLQLMVAFYSARETKEREGE